jgi:hypothetical protein
MDRILIKVTVLRFNDSFIVPCKPSDTLNHFKASCSRYCKYPIEDFEVICNGIIIKDSGRLCDTEILETLNVKLFVKSIKKSLHREERYNQSVIPPALEVLFLYHLKTRKIH